MDEKNERPDLPDLAALDNFLSLREKEIELGLEEASRDNKQLENERVLGLAAIEAGERDARDNREYLLKRWKATLCGVAFLAFLTLILIAVALFLDKDALLLKCVEIIAFYLSGLISGYGLKSVRDAARSPDSRD